MLNPCTHNIQESLKHAWHRGIGFLRNLAVKVFITVAASSGMGRRSKTDAANLWTMYKRLAVTNFDRQLVEKVS